MVYRITKDAVLIRLEKGDEILSSLQSLCEKENITLGEVSGIGACNEAVAGILFASQKRYVHNRWRETLELTSLIGTVTTKDGAPYLHLHATFAKLDGQVVGGHLDRAVISGTGEIVIRRMEGQVERQFDEAAGLNLMVL